MPRLFILSPAFSGGARARMLENPRAGFALAHRLQRGEAVPLAEVFSFLSGLYFRGKVAYARRFAMPPPALPGGWVITSNKGLVPMEEAVTLEQIRAFGAVPIDAEDPRYVEPMEQSCAQLRDLAPRGSQMILLGSVSTKKYTPLLLEAFGRDLFFPVDFIGRGDMSRGSLLLRSAVEGTELAYAPVQGALLKGKRPPRLTPRRWGYSIWSGSDNSKESSP